MVVATVSTDSTLDLFCHLSSLPYLLLYPCFGVASHQRHRTALQALLPWLRPFPLHPFSFRFLVRSGIVQPLLGLMYAVVFAASLEMIAHSLASAASSCGVSKGTLEPWSMKKPLSKFQF